jgi:hypothetical protein
MTMTSSKVCYLNRKCATSTRNKSSGWKWTAGIGTVPTVPPDNPFSEIGDTLDIHGDIFGDISGDNLGDIKSQ